MYRKILFKIWTETTVWILEVDHKRRPIARFKNATLTFKQLIRIIIDYCRQFLLQQLIQPLMQQKTLRTQLTQRWILPTYQALNLWRLQFKFLAISKTDTNVAVFAIQHYSFSHSRWITASHRLLAWSQWNQK